MFWPCWFQPMTFFVSFYLIFYTISICSLTLFQKSSWWHDIFLHIFRFIFHIIDENTLFQSSYKWKKLSSTASVPDMKVTCSIFLKFDRNPELLEIFKISRYAEILQKIDADRNQSNIDVSEYEQT